MNLRLVATDAGRATADASAAAIATRSGDAFAAAEGVAATDCWTTTEECLVVSVASSTSGAEATDADGLPTTLAVAVAVTAPVETVRTTVSDTVGVSSEVFLVGQASVTIRAMVGAGASGALMAGTGSASSVESGRDGALAAGRTLSDGTAAEADRAVARMTCSITAGGQRVSGECTLDSGRRSIERPKERRSNTSPVSRRSNHATHGERCTILQRDRPGARAARPRA